jgi:prepilin-type N-terminal cleavage/methylation domain-containing protein
MHAPDRPGISPAHARAHAGERGFTLVEIMVVCVIILILMGVAIIAFGGARGAVTSKEAIIAGTAYNDAISKFQADHANNLPAAGDMVTPTTGATARGPKSLLGANKPYLAQLPDGVVAGRVAVKMTPDNTDCGTAPGTPSTNVGTATSLVSYCPGTAPNYGIRVLYKLKKDADWSAAKVCWLGRSTNTPAC